MVFKVDKKSTGKIYYYTINGITQDVHDTYLSTGFNGEPNTMLFKKQEYDALSICNNVLTFLSHIFLMWNHLPLITSIANLTNK
jgi:hypothetical protein